MPLIRPVAGGRNEEERAAYREHAAFKKRRRAHKARVKRAKRAKGRRRKARRNPRRNPSSKAVIGALVGLGLGAFAWHMYVQSVTQQGTSLRDKYLYMAAGAGGAVGLLVGRKL